jgi:hypothetical protein
VPVLAARDELNLNGCPLVSEYRSCSAVMSRTRLLDFSLTDREILIVRSNRTAWLPLSYGEQGRGDIFKI